MLPTVASCIAATGGTLAALRAGEMAATSVTPIPTSQREHDRPGVEDQAPGGEAEPERGQQRLEARGHRDAGGQPDQRRR